MLCSPLLNGANAPRGPSADEPVLREPKRVRIEVEKRDTSSRGKKVAV